MNGPLTTGHGNFAADSAFDPQATVFGSGNSSGGETPVLIGYISGENNIAFVRSKPRDDSGEAAS